MRRPQPVVRGWRNVSNRTYGMLFALAAVTVFSLFAADGKVLLKGVEIQLGNRTLLFHATVNQRDGAIEYALVHRSGKVHESLLRTEIVPQDLHAGVLLVVGKIPTNGIPVEVEVRWTNATGAVTQTLAQLVRYADTRTPLEPGSWRYTGSEFFDGKFLAQTEGSLIALMHDSVALVNNPRRGSERDDLWEPNADVLPAVGTPVEVVLRLITPNSPPK